MAAKASYIFYVVALSIVTGMTIALPTQRTSQELCALKFRDYSVNHTACLAPREGAEKAVKEGVSEVSKTYIVNLHNYYRSNVHRYNNQPPATNMQKMYWDDELAMLAQKWASHCIWEHDEPGNRVVPRSYAVGQNLGRGHRGWGTVISHWQSEVNYLTFGKGKEPNRPIGHYTQMVWAESAKVGCGYARCNRTQAYYVCNYAPTGNMNKNKYSPYKAGERSASCSESTTPGLCDCKGKICLNGGTLDLNSCRCKCVNKPWIQQGGNCAIDCSKAEDSFACASNGGKWGLAECGKYANVPHEYCPITCNLCPANSATGSLWGTTEPAPKPTTPWFGNTGHVSTTPLLPVQPTSPFPIDQSNDTWWESVLNGNVAGKKTVPVPAPGFHTRAAPETVSTRTTPSTTTKTVTTSTSTTTPATSTTAGLPVCRTPVELSKCGQPSARGYYNPMYCAYGLAHYCPAMCGTCRVTSCVDYEDRTYSIGQSWMTEYGELTCTANGVKVRRGCHIEKVGIVISQGAEHTYMDGNIRWRCVCNTGYALSCKGVWTPASRRKQ